MYFNIQPYPQYGGTPVYYQQPGVSGQMYSQQSPYVPQEALHTGQSRPAANYPTQAAGAQKMGYSHQQPPVQSMTYFTTLHLS